MVHDPPAAKKAKMIGRQGRVTGRICAGSLGEVMISVRGGAEAFLAYASVPGEEFAVGALVCVIEYLPPRTVYVAQP